VGATPVWREAAMSDEFRLIPTRRSTEGDWFPAWNFSGDAESAIRSASDFYVREGVPVLVRQRGEDGLLTRSLGIFGERKLRAVRRR